MSLWIVLRREKAIFPVQPVSEAASSESRKNSEYDLGKSKKRHGSVLNLTEEEFQALEGKWGK